VASENTLTLIRTVEGVSAVVQQAAADAC